MASKFKGKIKSMGEASLIEMTCIKWSQEEFDKLCDMLTFDQERGLEFISSGMTAADPPGGKISSYAAFFIHCNLCLPITRFIAQLLTFSQVKSHITKAPFSFHDWKERFLYVKRDVIPLVMNVRSATDSFVEPALEHFEGQNWYIALTANHSEIKTLRESALVAVGMSHVWKFPDRVPHYAIGDKGVVFVYNPRPLNSISSSRETFMMLSSDESSGSSDDVPLVHRRVRRACQGDLGDAGSSPKGDVGGEGSGTLKRRKLVLKHKSPPFGDKLLRSPVAKKLKLSDSLKKTEEAALGHVEKPEVMPARQSESAKVVHSPVRQSSIVGRNPRDKVTTADPAKAVTFPDPPPVAHENSHAGVERVKKLEWDLSIAREEATRARELHQKVATDWKVACDQANLKIAKAVDSGKLATARVSTLEGENKGLVESLALRDTELVSRDKEIVDLHAQLKEIESAKDTEAANRVVLEDEVQQLRSDRRWLISECIPRVVDMQGFDEGYRFAEEGLAKTSFELYDVNYQQGLDEKTVEFDNMSFDVLKDMVACATHPDLIELRAKLVGDNEEAGPSRHEEDAVDYGDSGDEEEHVSEDVEDNSKV
ncbi:hypothetical protein L1987_53221 [Smallanthus sonchifolius]|uniref:Uncharacterized protein n=1 Tax=Smallanthus sonchifolius TaxID=185202 RepID=A0ACB9EVF0_9ASTR|nr:hypothetical protein L1987_53221 [Smallanthus sonchifolius]